METWMGMDRSTLLVILLFILVRRFAALLHGAVGLSALENALGGIRCGMLFKWIPWYLAMVYGKVSSELEQYISKWKEATWAGKVNPTCIHKIRARRRPFLQPSLCTWISIWIRPAIWLRTRSSSTNITYNQPVEPSSIRELNRSPKDTLQSKRDHAVTILRPNQPMYLQHCTHPAHSKSENEGQSTFHQQFICRYLWASSFIASVWRTWSCQHPFHWKPAFSCDPEGPKVTQAHLLSLALTLGSPEGKFHHRKMKWWCRARLWWDKSTLPWDSHTLR